MTQKKSELINKAQSILLTALLGAGIAFLQSLIGQTTECTTALADPAIAGTASAGLRTAYLYITSNFDIL